MAQNLNALNKINKIWSKILAESLEIKKKEPKLNFFVDKKIN